MFSLDLTCIVHANCVTLQGAGRRAGFFDGGAGNGDSSRPSICCREVRDERSPGLWSELLETVREEVWYPRRQRLCQPESPNSDWRIDCEQERGDDRVSKLSARITVSDSVPSIEVAELDDLQLCDLVRANAKSELGEAAFSELYLRFRGPALAQARMMTRDQWVAEDLVSETFARVLRAFANGRGPKESVLGYVLISLRTEAIRGREHDGQLISVAPEELLKISDNEFSSEADAYAERDQIGRAFASLTAQEQRVLWLLDVEDVTVEGAGEHLSMKAGAVRVAAHRARNRLATAYLQEFACSPRPECADSARYLAGFARAALGKRDAAKVTQHLGRCDLCTEQVARLRDLGKKLRVWAGPMFLGGSASVGATLGGADAPLALAATVQSSNAERASSLNVGKAVAWTALAAGLALMLAGGLLLKPQGPSNEPPDESSETAISSVQPRSPDPQVTDGAENFVSAVPSAGYGNELSTPETTVIPDDKTPNWILRC